MLTPKENVFERIWQSFFLIKNNFIQIFSPLLIYQILANWFIFSFVSYYILKTVNLTKLNLNNIKIDWISSIFLSNSFYLFLIFILLFLAYLLLIIPFFIATIKSIKNAYFEVENNLKDNISYWFSRFFYIFKTYWYIFAYVFLVPALAFIIWSILLILWKVKNVEMFLNFWMSLAYFSLVLFSVFYIYRWIETTFSLYNAIDKDEFDKENFYDSIDLTKNNWWRIVWNLLISMIIISLIISVFLYIISPFINLQNSEQINILTTNWIEMENINLALEKLKNFNISDFIWKILNIFLSSISQIFLYIFIYIFYKRLELEKNWDTSSKEQLKIIKDKKIIKEL
jgi:hypothetical protein